MYHEKILLKFCTVHKQKILSSVQVPGELRPFEEVKVFPKVNAFVKEVKVDRGSKVRQGDILIVLEAPEIEQQLQSAREKSVQAEANYSISKDKFDRLQSAAKTEGAVSVFDIASAKSKMNEDEAIMNAEKANVAAVEAMKDYLVMKAPFDGVIS